MIRFALIGSGWRALYYIRIAKALPELFEISAVLAGAKKKPGICGKHFISPLLQMNMI